MVTSERGAAILERLSVDLGAGRSAGLSLCETAVELLDLTGAGLALMGGGTGHATMGVSGPLMGVIEELQHTHGEGPCVEAHQRVVPVLEPNLARPAVQRWNGFAPPAVDAGARAVFGFPLRMGTVSIGALNLCSERIGSLTEQQHVDALLLADVSTYAILAMQSDAPLDGLAAELEDVGFHQVVVHQATGMVAAQLGCRVEDAVARLRGHAYANGRTVSQVATDVVARRLRLEV